MSNIGGLYNRAGSLPTWSNDMPRRREVQKSSKLLPILTLLLGTVGGSGAMWQWDNSQINHVRAKLETTTKVIEIREKIESNILRMLEFSKKYSDLDAEMNNTSEKSKVENIKAEIIRIQEYAMPLLMTDIIHLENILSKMENRETRDFKLIRLLIPAAPYNLRGILVK